MKFRRWKLATTIPYGIIIPLFTFLSIYSIYKISDFFLQPKTSNPFVLIPAEFVNQETPKTKQPPTSVSIPRIRKTLPVQAAIVEGNNWQLFDKSVAWLSTSAVPGHGNVILYAHDWPSLWGDLYKMEPGDIVDVDMNGTIFSYKVTESRAVSKNDVDAVLSNDNRLTMYTCEGTFDQKRRVVYALPL